MKDISNSFCLGICERALEIVRQKSAKVYDERVKATDIRPCVGMEFLQTNEE